MATTRRYRSFFWPVVLIVIGIFALLVELNVVSSDRLYRLADLWPLILIVIGLELITRRALQGTAVDVAAVLILVLAAGSAVAYVSLGPAVPGGIHTLDASEPIGTLNAAALHVEVGAVTMTVQGDSSLGSDLYKAHIEYSGPKPTITFDKSTGDVRISQEGGFAFFGNRRVVLYVQINPAVTWGIDINSGAATDTLKLGAIRVTSIELNTGASREEITLGPPKGMVQITINGGALTVHVHRPNGIAASAQVSGGAVNLTGDGRQARGIGSKSWQSDGFDTAADGYRIEVNGGASNVTVDTATPSA